MSETVATEPAAPPPPVPGPAPDAPLLPVAEGERYALLDILRGFALFGILLVNMATFKSPGMYVLPGAPAPMSLVDRVATGVIDLLAETKFYTLFSFLFGVGFSIQLGRARQRGGDVRFERLFARRLFVLLGIGLAHGFLIWHGDILAWYALTGFLLLFFRNCRPDTPLVWALVVYGMTAISGLLGVAVVEGVQLLPGVRQILGNVDKQINGLLTELRAPAVATYGSGSYRDIFVFRAREMGVIHLNFLFIFPIILANFLLGLWAGWRGLPQNVGEHLPFVRKVMIRGLVVGLTSNALYLLAAEHMNFLSAICVLSVNIVVGAPALCFFYAASIALLAQDPLWQKRFAPLAAAGRMALTNYLAQSLVCTTLFYGYGFGLYGRVGPALGIGLTVALYAAQLAFSVWWLRRFRFGPMEWLWRSLTYGKRQPMRLREGTIVAAG